MPRILTTACALLVLLAAACSGPGSSRSFDSGRPAIEVRPGIPSQERGAKEFLYKGAPVYLGDATYFHVAEASATTDDRGRRAIAITIADEDLAAAEAWRRTHVGEVAAVLLEGHVLMTGIVKPHVDGPLVLSGHGSGATRAEIDFLVKLLNGEY